MLTCDNELVRMAADALPFPLSLGLDTWNLCTRLEKRCTASANLTLCSSSWTASGQLLPNNKEFTASLMLLADFTTFRACANIDFCCSYFAFCFASISYFFIFFSFLVTLILFSNSFSKVSLAFRLNVLMLSESTFDKPLLRITLLPC